MSEFSTAIVGPDHIFMHAETVGGPGSCSSVSGLWLDILKFPVPVDKSMYWSCLPVCVDIFTPVDMVGQLNIRHETGFPADSWP